MAGLKEIVPSTEFIHALRLLSQIARRRRITDQIQIHRPGRGEIDVSITVAFLHARLASVILREQAAGRTHEKSGVALLEEMARRFSASPVPQAVFFAKKLTDANPAFRELFASVLADNETPTLQQLLGRDLHASARALIQVAETTGASERILPNLSLSVGETANRMVDLIASRVHFSERNGVLLTVIDHTVREAKIRELDHVVHSLRVVADNDVSPAIVVRQERILWANKAFAMLLGLVSTDEVSGNSIEQFLIPRDRRSVPGRLGAADLEAEEKDSLECSLLSHGTKPLRVEAVVQRIEFEGGPAGLAVLRNVTGKLKSTEELKEKLDEVRRLQKILASARGDLDPLSCTRALFEGGLKQLGFDAGICYSVDQDAPSIAVVASENIPEAASATLTTQSLHEGISGYVARTQTPLHLQLEHYPPHLPYKILFESAGFHTIVYLPVASQNVLHGIFLFCAKKSIDQSELTSEFLESFARDAGDIVGAAWRYERLREAENRSRVLLESIPDIAYELSADGSFTMLSGRVEALLGHKKEEFFRNPDLWRHCVHPDDRSLYSSRVGDRRKDRQGGELVYRVLPKGKAEARMVRDVFTQVYNEEGALVAVRGIVADVTDLIGEKSPRTDEAPGAQPSAPVLSMSDLGVIMTDVIDKMGDAFIITDLQGRIAEVNTEFTHLTGFTRQEAIGMQLPYPWLLDEEYGTIMRWITALREKMALRDFDMNWVARDGVRMAISLNTSLLRNTSGEPYAMLNIARNITERKTLADTLSRTNRRVEMLNRIVSAANATLDITSIFDVVATEIVSMVPCEIVALDLLSDDRRSMEIRACFVQGDLPGSYRGKISSVEGTSAQRVIETREPVLFNEVPESGDILPSYAAEFASFLSTPVILNDRVIGTLDLGSRERAMFAPEDIGVLQPIADQVGAAVQNALLYAQIQAQVERVHALYKVGESLAGAPDTEQVLRVVAEEMLHSLSYDRFVFTSSTPDESHSFARAFAASG